MEGKFPSLSICHHLQGAKGTGGLPGSDGDPGEDVSSMLFLMHVSLFREKKKTLFMYCGSGGKKVVYIFQGPLGVPGLVGVPGPFGPKVRENTGKYNFGLSPSKFNV